MRLFYTRQIVDNTAIMDENESVHCIRVLRKKKGDLINFTDGRGKFYEGIIIEENSKKCTLEISNVMEESVKHPYHLHIAIAPTKNIDRFEWFVEKAVEIGVDSITPLICHYSERKKLRADRIEKIIVSAMKQSLKSYLPKLNPLTPFNDFILNEKDVSNKYIAHLEDDDRKELVLQKGLDSNFLILIGPEGDFHPDEISLALKNGFLPVSLGNYRLRTETAGVVACQTFSSISNLNG